LLLANPKKGERWKPILVSAKFLRLNFKVRVDIGNRPQGGPDW
jgi:hypothetical protein